MDFWVSMGTYGCHECLWVLYLNIRNIVRFLMQKLWVYMDFYGYLWVFYGFLWVIMGFWLSMGIYGCHGCLWVFGCLWVSMGVYGFLGVYGYL